MVIPNGGLFLGVLGIREKVPVIGRYGGFEGVEEVHVFREGHEALEGDVLVDQLGAVLMKLGAKVAEVGEAEVGVGVEKVVSESLGQVSLLADNFETWPEMNANEPLDALLGKRGVARARSVPALVHFEVIIDAIHAVKSVHVDFFLAVALPDELKVLVLA